MIALSHIASALDAHVPRRLPVPPAPRDRAAVSLVLNGTARDLALCFIRRASREGDRWSGHMAFPGGRGSPLDAGPRDVAIRETLEEVGLGLEPGDCIGTLSEMPVSRKGGLDDGVLSPFVFYRAGPRPDLVPEPAEVAAAYWIPLAHLWEPARHTRMRRDDRGGERTFPAIRFRDEIIWGLTYRVLWSFSQVLRVPLGPGRPAHPHPYDDRPPGGRGQA